MDTGMKTVVGTPGYIAPESLIDASYTTGSDIYAVGVCIYTMLGMYLQKKSKMQFQKCSIKNVLMVVLLFYTYY